MVKDLFLEKEKLMFPTHPRWNIFKKKRKNSNENWRTTKWIHAAVKSVHYEWENIAWIYDITIEQEEEVKNKQKTKKQKNKKQKTTKKSKKKKKSKNKKLIVTPFVFN